MPNSKDEKRHVEKIKKEKYRNRLEALVKERTAELTKTREVMKQKAVERNEAERTLRKIEREQSTVLENLSDLIVYRNTDMETVWASKSMADWHGITQEQIIGRICYKARFGRNEPCEDCHVVEAMKSGKRRKLEKQLPDGKYWHVIVNPAFNDSGEVIGTIEVSQDITERKRAEQVLRQSEEKYRKLFEEAQDGIFLADAKTGIIVDCNLAAAEMVERKKSEIIGQHQRILHPADKIEGGFSVSFKKHLRECEGQVLEDEVITRTGRIKHAAIKANLLHVGNRKLLQAIFHDITDRKKAREELEKSKDILEKTFSSLDSAVFILDARKPPLIIDCNPAATRIFGYEKQEMVGNTTEFLHIVRETLSEFQEQLSRSVEKKGFLSFFEFKMKRKDGTIFPSEHSVRPLKDDKGLAIGWISVVRDITERKQSEEALRETTGLLETIFEHTHMLVACLDRQFNFICVNRAYAEADERRPSFFPGKNHFKLYPHAENERIFRRVVETGESYFAYAKPFEYDAHPERGISYWDWSLVPIKQHQGIVTGLVFTLVDVTARKRAEEALRASEGKLDAMLQSISDHMSMMDRDLNIIWANDTAKKQFGEDVVGKKCYEVYHGKREPCQPQPCLVLRVFEDGLVHEHETEVIERNGNSVCFHCVANVALRDSDGNATAVLEVSTDITDRKRTEQALRESEEKFRSLAEQSPNMIFINKKGTVVYANKKCEEVVGYTREELCSTDFDFRSLVAPESLGLINDNFARHLRGEEVQPYDYSIIKKDGKRVEAINTSKLIQYEGEAAILGIVTDITERKSAEQALRESEERLKILFESAPDTIYLVDSEGRFMDANRAAFELVGFSRNEVIGKSLAEIGLLSPAQLSRAKENLKKVVAGKLSGPNEYRLKRKDGTHISVEVRTFPVKIAGTVLTLGIARDITEHKRTEKELLEHQAKLKSLASQLSLTEERERHRLATDLHDQISQSLVISKIKLDQLSKSSSSDEFNEPLADISNCLGQIIDDTRALTFDLSYPILYELGFEAAVAEWLTDQIQEKHGIRSEFVNDRHQKPLDDDIRVLLFRNVRELLINVIKHAQANKVKVSIRKVKDHIRVSVEDDGVGFDPVEVASMATKRAEFGLFSIRERLEQLGGLIEINSKMGRGSKITMTAPLRREDLADGT